MMKDGVEETIEKGRQAVLIDTLLYGYVRDRREAVITKGIAQYRGGSLTPERALALIGELTALFDLTVDLEADQRRGNIAAQKEFSQ